MERKELFYLVALAAVQRLGPITIRALIDHFGCASAVFEAEEAALQEVQGVGEHLAKAIKNQKDPLAFAESELAFVERNGLQLITYRDADYPRRLSYYPDAPLVLYYLGGADLNPDRIVGIVGTRSPTHQGVQFVEELMDGLKDYRPLVISGLAYGIDAAAHRAALEAGLPTVACLAHGLRTLYPSAHRKLAAKMREEGGLLTEHHSRARPLREHFPLRNRIVAAMSDALIVVESGEEGGSMITASLANGYGKEVFAVPGRLRDAKSAGCNKLIKTHQASLLQSAEDIAYLLGWNKPLGGRGRQLKMFQELSEPEQQLVLMLEEEGSLSFDQLSRRMSMGAGRLSALLLELECKNVVQTAPGKRFELL